MQNNITENLNQWNKISRYSKWMYDVYKMYIGKRVLDIGAGIGTVTGYYIEGVDSCVATELFDNQVAYMNERFKNFEYFHACNFDIMTNEIKQLGEGFDTVICINVLEHIEDHALALRKINSVMSNNGKLIICVPAMSKLYCYMDKNVGHFRRYDKDELKNLAGDCGFQVVDNFYFNLMGIIPYWLKGRLGKDKGGSFSTDLNENNSKLYNFAAAILEPIEKVIRPRGGISEFIILTPDKSCKAR